MIRPKRDKNASLAGANWKIRLNREESAQIGCDLESNAKPFRRTKMCFQVKSSNLSETIFTLQISTSDGSELINVFDTRTSIAATNELQFYVLHSHSNYRTALKLAK